MDKIKLNKKEYELLKKALEFFDNENDKYTIKGLFKEEEDNVDYKMVPFDLKLVNDFGCRVTTKSGREVRIVCQDRKGNAPIVGLIEGDKDNEVLMPYNKDGIAMGPYFADENMDLACLVKKRTIAAYVYEDEYGIPHAISVNDALKLNPQKHKIVDKVEVDYFKNH